MFLYFFCLESRIICFTLTRWKKLKIFWSRSKPWLAFQTHSEFCSIENFCPGSYQGWWEEKKPFLWHTRVRNYIFNESNFLHSKWALWEMIERTTILITFAILHHPQWRKRQPIVNLTYLRPFSLSMGQIGNCSLVKSVRMWIYYRWSALILYRKHIIAFQEVITNS